MRERLKLTGLRFGKWLVLGKNNNVISKQTHWLCKCECGKISTIIGTSLTSGNSKSCGNCFKGEYFARDGYMVGLTRKGEEFIFDKEDLELVKKHIWYIQDGYVACSDTYNKGAKRSDTILLHRYLMNPSSGTEIDHINCIRNDNRRINLREVLPIQNKKNVAKRTAKTSSKYKGVCWCKTNKYWVAHIANNGKKYCLGHYKEEIKAALVYNQKAIELHGEYARLNVV